MFRIPSKLNKLKEPAVKYSLGKILLIKLEKDMSKPNKSLPSSRITCEILEHSEIKPEHRNSLQFKARAQRTVVKHPEYGEQLKISTFEKVIYERKYEME